MDAICMSVAYVRHALPLFFSFSFLIHILPCQTRVQHVSGCIRAGWMYHMGTMAKLPCQCVVSINYEPQGYDRNQVKARSEWGKPQNLERSLCVFFLKNVHIKILDFYGVILLRLMICFANYNDSSLIDAFSMDVWLLWIPLRLSIFLFCDI